MRTADVATDRLTWSSNVETTLAGFARTALATGAGFAARITCDSESSRFHVVHNGPARDEGQGVPFRVSYRMASSQGALYEVEDFLSLVRRRRRPSVPRSRRIAG